MLDFLDSSVTTGQYVAAVQETIYMVGISLVLGSLLGIPIALLLVLTRPNGLTPQPVVYALVNAFVNIVRSLPFIILMVAILPFTRVIVHTSIGTTAALVPLTLYIAPYIGRLIENSLLEVHNGILEAAAAMGATVTQTIRYFLLPEAKASILLSLTTATIGLIGATAMAGVIGGGGIGDLAISYGYKQFDTPAIVITVIVLVIVVQAIQSLGNWAARHARGAN